MNALNNQLGKEKPRFFQSSKVGIILPPESRHFKLGQLELRAAGIRVRFPIRMTYLNCQQASSNVISSSWHTQQHFGTSVIKTYNLRAYPIAFQKHCTSRPDLHPRWRSAIKPNDARFSHSRKVLSGVL
jgi:hypothetical protein